MRSVPEPSSAVGSPVTGRDPWAGFGAGPSLRGRRPVQGANGGSDREPDRDLDDEQAVADLAHRLRGRLHGPGGPLHPGVGPPPRPPHPPPPVPAPAATP